MSFLKKLWNNIKTTAFPKVKILCKKLILPLSFFLIVAVISGGLIWWRIKTLTNEFIALPPIDEPPSNSIISSDKIDGENIENHNSASEIETVSETGAVGLEPEITVAPVLLPDPVWDWPVKGEIIKKYGVVYWPTFNDWRQHNGIDILVGQDGSIGAAAVGRVKSIERDEKWGNIITIEHGSNYSTVYKGEGKVMALVNSEVQALESIMIIEKSSLVEMGLAKHLHFSIIYQGNYVDPLGILPVIK